MFDLAWWKSITKTFTCRTLILQTLVLGLVVSTLVTGCSKKDSSTIEAEVVVPQPEPVEEVSPPQAVQILHQSLDRYQPQVRFLSPRNERVLQDNQLEVKIQVQNLPIFQDENSDLGPHVQVILDNLPPQTLYDLTQSLVLSDLEPGTHTLRAFAVYPWGESFKNDGAYDQITFHIFTRTPANNPNPQLPLLTYNEPQGTFGGEPVLLDFYLHNAPLHVAALESPDDAVEDWRIRATVNGDSFIVDQWQPIYLTGVRPGKNWVQLEFLDEVGEPLDNVYNNTARIFTYDPKAADFRSRLLRGDLSLAQARSIVDPDYIPGAPMPPLPGTEPEVIESEVVEAAAPDTVTEDITPESEDMTSEEAPAEELSLKAITLEEISAEAETESAETGVENSELEATPQEILEEIAATETSEEAEATEPTEPTKPAAENTIEDEVETVTENASEETGVTEVMTEEATEETQAIDSEPVDNGLADSSEDQPEPDTDISNVVLPDTDSTETETQVISESGSPELEFPELAFSEPESSVVELEATESSELASELEILTTEIPEILDGEPSDFTEIPVETVPAPAQTDEAPMATDVAVDNVSNKLNAALGWVKRLLQGIQERLQSLR
ncbi:MAG: hypothetical protein ACFBSC_13240 [Microcoleaceae cyanobacterium]